MQFFRHPQRHCKGHEKAMVPGPSHIRGHKSCGFPKRTGDNWTKVTTYAGGTLLWLSIGTCLFKFPFDYPIAPRGHVLLNFKWGPWVLFPVAIEKKTMKNGTL